MTVTRTARTESSYESLASNNHTSGVSEKKQLLLLKSGTIIDSSLSKLDIENHLTNKL